MYWNVETVNYNNKVLRTLLMKNLESIRSRFDARYSTENMN